LRPGAGVRAPHLISRKEWERHPVTQCNRYGRAHLARPTDEGNAMHLRPGPASDRRPEDLVAYHRSRRRRLQRTRPLPVQRDDGEGRARPMTMH
jgi:hypothetical protein